jgi:O-antigen/teichoic acid export membrane protein
LVIGSPQVQAFLSIGHDAWYIPAATYVFGYAFYFLFKMAYFAYGRVAMYVRSEVIAVSVLFVSLLFAFREGRPAWFALALILHPVIFIAMALRDLRSCYGWTFAGDKRITSTGEYLGYATFWLASAASGLAAYHGSILVLSVGGSHSATVGYYALCLSLIAPLNFLPSILSQVMFPRMAANSAVGAASSNSLLIREVTSTLIVFLILAVSMVCGCASWILRAVGMTSSPAWIAVVQLLTVGTSVSLLSTPCGNFLFADSYAKISALIGACSLGVGVIVWGIAVPRWGAVGSALGYAALMTVRGVSNMVVANQYARWQDGFPWRWLVATGFVSLLCGVAYAPLNEGTRTMLVGVVIVGILLLFTEEVRRVLAGMPLHVDVCAGGRPDG